MFLMEIGTGVSGSVDKKILRVNSIDVSEAGFNALGGGQQEGFFCWLYSTCFTEDTIMLTNVAVGS